jgi:hypothetical protein
MSPDNDKDWGKLRSEWEGLVDDPKNIQAGKLITMATQAEKSMDKMIKRGRLTPDEEKGRKEELAFAKGLIKKHVTPAMIKEFESFHAGAGRTPSTVQMAGGMEKVLAFARGVVGEQKGEKTASQKTLKERQTAFLTKEIKEAEDFIKKNEGSKNIGVKNAVESARSNLATYKKKLGEIEGEKKATTPAQSTPSQRRRLQGAITRAKFDLTNREKELASREKKKELSPGELAGMRAEVQARKKHLTALEKGEKVDKPDFNKVFKETASKVGLAEARKRVEKETAEREKERGKKKTGGEKKTGGRKGGKPGKPNLYFAKVDEHKKRGKSEPAARKAAEVELSGKRGSTKTSGGRTGKDTDELLETVVRANERVKEQYLKTK